MIDPVVEKVLIGTIVYGIVILYSASAFQLYRRERKSALILGLLATSVILIALTVRLARHGAG